jgi:hypothetical protein
VVAGELGLAAIAMVLWPRPIAYAFRQGMFGGGGRATTRPTSLGLSTAPAEIGFVDNGDGDDDEPYEPKDEHLLNAYGAVSYFVVLPGAGRRDWQVSLMVGMILLIGRFILGRVRPEKRASRIQ